MATFTFGQDLKIQAIDGEKIDRPANKAAVAERSGAYTLHETDLKAQPEAPSITPGANINPFEP